MTGEAEVDTKEPRYRVTEVIGHPPVSLEDFLGATTVIVEMNGHQDRLIGIGVKVEHQVRFHERETSSARVADPVWTFTDQGGGAIAAEPPSPDPDDSPPPGVGTAR